MCYAEDHPRETMRCALGIFRTFRTAIEQIMPLYHPITLEHFQIWPNAMFLFLGFYNRKNKG